MEESRELAVRQALDSVENTANIPVTQTLVLNKDELRMRVNKFHQNMGQNPVHELSRVYQPNIELRGLYSIADIIPLVPKDEIYRNLVFGFFFDQGRSSLHNVLISTDSFVTNEDNLGVIVDMTRITERLKKYEGVIGEDRIVSDILDYAKKQSIYVYEVNSDDEIISEDVITLPNDFNLGDRINPEVTGGVFSLENQHRIHIVVDNKRVIGNLRSDYPRFHDANSHLPDKQHNLHVLTIRNDGNNIVISPGFESAEQQATVQGYLDSPNN